MKKLYTIALLLLFSTALHADELLKLTEACNKEAARIKSAYYEASVIFKCDKGRKQYSQKVYYKKAKTKNSLPMFNLLQLSNNKEEFQQYYNNSQFTVVDFEQGLAFQYEKEDKQRFLPMIDKYVLHPYSFAKTPFDKKNKNQELELLKDTLIDEIPYKRIRRFVNHEDNTKQEDVFFINPSNYIIEKLHTIFISNASNDKVYVQNLQINYTRFNTESPFLENRFVYEASNNVQKLKYMSVSALEKEWIEQEKAHRSLAYGNFAENFVAMDYNGERIDTKELNDKVLVVAFYYNICPPCMLMLQDLEKLYQNIASEDLKIVAINPIDNQFDNNELREFANKRKLSYHLCGVKRKTIEESYLIYSYPTIFIIDKEGKIRFSHQGYNDLFYEKVDKVIRKIL